MPMCAPKAVEKLASTDRWSVISVEVILSMPMPPYSSGISTEVKPSSAALRIRSAHDARLLGLNGGDCGKNLFAGKLGGRGGNLALLLVQIFRGKDLGGGAGFKQETAAGGGDDGGDKQN